MPGTEREIDEDGQHQPGRERLQQELDHRGAARLGKPAADRLVRQEEADGEQRARARPPRPEGRATSRPASASAGQTADTTMPSAIDTGSGLRATLNAACRKVLSGPCPAATSSSISMTPNTMATMAVTITAQHGGRQAGLAERREAERHAHVADIAPGGGDALQAHGGKTALPVTAKPAASSPCRAGRSPARRCRSPASGPDRAPPPTGVRARVPKNSTGRAK